MRGFTVLRFIWKVNFERHSRHAAKFTHRGMLNGILGIVIVWNVKYAWINVK